MSTAEIQQANKVFGKGVATLRRVAGWNQGQLGKRVGLSQATISEIERGVRALTAADIFMFTDVFTTELGISEEVCLRAIRTGSLLDLLRPPITTTDQGGTATSRFVSLKVA